MANALDAINNAINQYSSSNPWGTSSDDAINQINQQSALGLQNTLNQLKQKINDSLNTQNQKATDTTNQYNSALNTLNQSLQAVPAKYQPEYNQHATQAALALRNVMEQAANRGDVGGMMQQNQLAVNTAQQNADAATDTSKNNEILNYNNQISDTNTKKAEALQAIKDAIDTLNSDAESQLGSDISSANQSRLGNIATQQAAEAAAAEKQYEAQLAAQARIEAAQIAHSGSSSGGSSSGSSSSSSSGSSSSDIGLGTSGDNVASIQSNLQTLGYDVGGIDGVYGGNTESAMKQFQADYGLPQTGIYDTKTAQTMADIENHLNDIANDRQYQLEESIANSGQNTRGIAR